MRLPDAVLADLLAKADKAAPAYASGGQQRWDMLHEVEAFTAPLTPATVSALVREVQRLRQVEREHYEATHCHCGRWLTAWCEPACDGCDRVPESCYCAPLSPPSESPAR